MSTDRAEQAFIAHRDALTEILRGGENYDRTLIVEALVTINEWSIDQRYPLISEILYACDACALDTVLLGSLNSTITYLNEHDLALRLRLAHLNER